MVKRSGRVKWRLARAHIRRVAKHLPWRKVCLLFGAWILGTVMIVQLFYPSDRLLPLQRVDGLAVGAKSKTDAIKALDTAYANKKIDVYLGSNQSPVTAPTFEQAGLSVDNTGRVQAMRYAWYWRLVPSSLFWANSAISAPKLVTSSKSDEFLTTKLLTQCQPQPQNATLKAEGAKLVVVPAKNGGECDGATVKKEFTAITPSLSRPVAAHISMKEITPDVVDAEAQASADHYMAQVKDGIALTVEGQQVTLPAADVYSWLDFTPNDITVDIDVNLDKIKPFMDKSITPKVAIAPGTATVTTKDFEEVSRVGGSDGRTLDLGKTAASIGKVVQGNSGLATAVTQVVPANITYVRSYSSTDTGLNALLSNFAKDHNGTFGISYAELSGDRRRANFQGDKQFVTASTYKLFVAYSVLKHVESGQMSWEENQTCFNKMISNSDNACAEAFLFKVGLKTVTSEINALGLKDSNFTKEGGPYTTANDLVIYLGTLEGGSMFSDTSKQRLVSAMLGNTFRNGVPAGASGQVADKVGFMNGLLHDAAIVYSPKGTYALAVMTDGSTWGTIADLTREIEKIR